MTTTTPDPDLEAAMADALGTAFVVVGHLTRLADAALDDWGLTSRQWLLLAVLARGFGGREAALSEAAAAYVPDSSDGRTTRIALTGQAARFDSPDGQARGRAVLEAAFAGLGADDVIALRGLLHRWVTALATRAPSHPITASRRG
jgi:hypothetical protein